MGEKIVTGQFSDTFVPIMDGVSITARNYAFWLNRKYGTSYAVGPFIKGYEDSEEFTVLRYRSVPLPGLDPFRLGIPQMDWEFHKKIESIQFDIVHAHCPFVSGQIALKAAEEQRIPLVATFHSKYKEDFKTKIPTETLVDMAVKKVVRFYNSVDHVWVPAKSTGEVLREYGYQGKIEVWENGTDIPIPTDEEYRELFNRGQEYFNTTEDDIVFLFVGQHRWVKNIELIIEALRTLNDRGRSFKMVFVGSGPDKKAMEKMVYTYNLWDRVFFTGSIINREEIKPIYARANLFLFPSIYDNAPLVMREAAAFKVPTVLVEGSTAAEVIKDKKNGFLIENSPEALADELEILMDDNELVKRVGMKARESIYISWEQVVDKVYLRYQEIIEQFRSK